MPRLTLNPKKLLKILLRAGFKIDHITGSHYILYNPISKKHVTLPLHKKDLPKGTLHSIIKSAGLSEEDF
ncbi:MAG: type II toxin-antitoxin system HicA family toxin [bacterium]|nr:type II toxin-antitoxin system HicA family toxin [bacterium]